jgi:putative ABC transport system ATP-binding protein
MKKPAQTQAGGAGDSRPFIAVEKVVRNFKMGSTIVRALRGVNLTVQRGEMLCLMGPSGSGKTTLLNAIGGLDQPDEGRIVVDGKDITRLDSNGLATYRQKLVGFVFQTFNLIPTMTALQNVEFPMIFAGVPVAERRKRARRLLTQVGLGDRMDHRPTELSGGQQQRVAIARSLINRPRLLLADEPTGNLDSKTGTEIMTLLQALNRQGLTMVLVSHDPRTSDWSTRTIHMLDGHITSEATNGANAIQAGLITEQAAGDPEQNKVSD